MNRDGESYAGNKQTDPLTRDRSARSDSAFRKQGIFGVEGILVVFLYLNSTYFILLLISPATLQTLVAFAIFSIGTE